MSKWIQIIAVIGLLVASSASFAGFRCVTGSLVHKGDTQSEVENTCGAPMDVSYKGAVKHRGRWVSVELWTYNPGKGRLYKILEFHDGVLKDVDNGGRVR